MLNYQVTKFYRHFTVDEENYHCVCSYTGLICPGQNGPLRMHTTDPAVPPSFSLVQGKTGGLLTMLGTSGVGNVGKEWLIWLCWKTERFLIGWKVCAIADGDLSVSPHQSNEDKRLITASSVPLLIIGLHKWPNAGTYIGKSRKKDKDVGHMHSKIQWLTKFGVDFTSLGKQLKEVHFL